MFRFALISIVLLGCSDKQAPPVQEDIIRPGSVAAEEARNTFNNLCSVCHGQSGTGDGPGAASLDPKPRNYTDKAWQASITDEQIRRIILEGGAAVGKSQMMPASPQFKDKPLVVDELVKIVRSFGH